MQRSLTLSKDQAEAIALSAVAWLVADQDLRERFLAMTGLQPLSIRDGLQDPAFLAGLLDWLLAHEPTLLRFSHEGGVAPEKVAEARSALAGRPVSQ